MSDPIDKPGFNPHRGREANPERIERIRELGEEWKGSTDLAKAARRQLVAEIKSAKAAGHSFRQLADALGVSIGTIQGMVREE
jgi:hypothetical protein